MTDSMDKYGSAGVPFTGDIAEIKSAQEQIQRMIDALVPVVQRMIDALVPVVQRMIDALVPFIPPILDEITNLWEAMLRSYPNKRVVWLAFHHKKERVRKKNRKRIIEYYVKAANHHDHDW